MNTKLFSDAMSEIEDRYIHEALQYKNKRKNGVWQLLAYALLRLVLLSGSNLQLPSQRTRTPS